MTVRPCTEDDFAGIIAVINDGAEAYRGVIPADRWHDPYMSDHALAAEIAAGVGFWGWPAEGHLAGVMGVQDVEDVILIRHAYVRRAHQRQGVGGRLLDALLETTGRPVLVGTWAAAGWAVRFYEKHGFRRVTADQKDRLLRRYWSIPERQIETSVVLADGRWRARAGG